MLFVSFIIFTCSLTIDINQIQYTSDTYDNILSLYGSSVNTIKSLIIIEGDFSISAISNQYSQLETLEIPSQSFTGSINSEKFKDMISLKSVKIDGVTSISANSFQNCIQLETISFPSCLTIGNYAFSGCLQLKTVNFPVLTTLGAYCFEKTGLIDIELNSVYVLNTAFDLLVLKGCQFSGCSQLQRVTMKKVPLIQRYMFENCQQLQFIDAPLALSIGIYGFVGCSSLISIDLPSVMSIGENCFSNCPNLMSARFESCTLIEEEAFSGCSSLENVYFPRLRKVGTSVFAQTGLVEVELNSLMEIETEFELWIGDVGRQFQGCSKLKSVTMNSVQTIKSYMFEDCMLLTEINLPSCTTIETNSFISCRNIQKVTLGYLTVSFRNIPDSTILTHISFPSALAVSSNAFSNMKNLVSCKLPLVSVIGAGLFSEQTQLTEVFLPNVKEIQGDSTFYNCGKLEMISLLSLTTVDPSATQIFKGCNSLKFIYLPKSPPKTFNKDTFQGLSCDIVIPKESIEIYDNDVSIDGDVAGDKKWCGIELKKFNLINCSINILFNGLGTNLLDSIRAVGITESNVRSLQIHEGKISQDDLNSFQSTLYNLNALVIEETVEIENEKIPKNFLLNNKEVISVTIKSSVKTIDESAFEGCSRLMTFSCPTVIELNSRCFYGPSLIESFSFDNVTSLVGSDFFSNNANLKSIYLPQLESITVTGYISQNSPLLETIVLPKNPPKIISGTFLFDINPSLIGLTNNESKIYDAADGIDRDMKYCSLKLSYTLISCLIDGEIISGISLKDIVKEGSEFVEVLEGQIFETDFPLPSSVISFTVPETVDIEKLPSNAMNQSPTLKRVAIYSNNDFIINENAFSGCSSLESVIIKGATLLNESAFKDCTSLKSVFLDNIKEIVGNFQFDGCHELTTVSLRSLTKVPNDSSMIFNNCLKLTSLKLPSAPPSSFNNETFAGLQNQLSISLPSESDYSTYDNDVSIVGDEADDNLWCGILLPTERINVKINNQNSLTFGKDLSECISNSGISESLITSLEIHRGIVDATSLNDIIKKLPFLESLTVSKSVVFTGSFIDGMFSSLNIVSINLPSIETIPQNFFKDCIHLKSVVIDDAIKICSSAFKGCTSLETINLNVEELEGDSHFEGCILLSHISLTNLKIVDSTSSKIFENCPLTSICLPSTPPKTFNNKTFVGKNVVIHGLSSSILKLYDSNTDVEGDQANDRKWCGIDLIQTYILISINGADPVYSDTIENAAKEISKSEISKIEIQNGMFKKDHFNELKSYSSLTIFSVTENAVLETSVIETDYFKDNKNIVNVSIMQDVLLMSYCFSGCLSLTTVNFKTALLVNEAAFKSCSSLSMIKIPLCKELKGDSIFSGCSKLTELDLSSLQTVQSSATKIFEGCSSLSVIKLPSKEPSAFHPGSFSDCQKVKLVLPMFDDYVIYDDYSHVEGDVEMDSKWCGIEIDQSNLPPLLHYKINNVEHKQRKKTIQQKTLTSQKEETLKKLVKDDSNESTKVIELVNGSFDASFLKEIVGQSQATIEKFEANEGTLSEIETGTFYGCNSLKEIIIHPEVKLAPKALQNIPSLTKLEMSLQQTLQSDEFEGDDNLQYVSLPLLKTIPSSLFANHKNLQTVKLDSAMTMLNSCFANCQSIQKIDLPKIELIEGDSHFQNCFRLENVDLSALRTVDQQSSNIFGNCNQLKTIKLGNWPPNTFNENIFVKAGVVPTVSIPNPNYWNYYLSQCTVDPVTNHYLWYGFDIGYEKNKEVCPKCPKNQNSIVIALAVLTAIFGAGCIALLTYILIKCCKYGISDGVYP